MKKKETQKKEDTDSIPEPMAVVYGPPPRPPKEDHLSALEMDLFNNPPSPPSVTSLFAPIPPPSPPPKKKSTGKQPENNPEDRADVYGPPPSDDLFPD
jgi:hypothetical protein